MTKQKIWKKKSVAVANAEKLSNKEDSPSNSNKDKLEELNETGTDQRIELAVEVDKAGKSKEKSVVKKH